MVKRVLFTVDSYIPHTSGVPVVVQYLAEGLTNRGYDVVLCTRWTEGLAEKENIGGVDVYRFKIDQTLLKAPTGEIEKYRKFVIALQADVNILECAECVTTDVLLDVLPQLRGKKVFHSHGFYGMKLKPFRWNVNLKYSIGNTYNWLRFRWYYFHKFRKAIGLFDETICLSDVDSSKLWLEKYSKKVTVLQNAVDDIFCEKTKSMPLESIAGINKPYLLAVCTYSKQKNQIGIVREYYKANINLPLVFVGPLENEYYHLIHKEINLLASKFGKKEIYTFTHVKRKYIPDVIGNAKLYLVGSVFEEYSISLIETMTKGVPFISTNVGNARTLPGGLTISKMSDMHSTIEKLLADEVLYKQLSERGKAFVEANCRRKKAVDLLEEIINR